MFLLFLGMTTINYSQNTKETITEKKETSTTKKTKTKIGDGIFAEIQTTKGTILVALEYQKTPITVANFIALAEGKNTFVTDPKLKGKPFYDGLKFHRVIKDFMIQGGDPSGDGSGGPGYAFKDEFTTELKHDKAGVLSMANSGPTTNGSQFFITYKETPWLNGKHTIFGHVVNGMDVVNTIVQDDVINNIKIVRKGSLAKKFKAPKVFANYYDNRAENARKEAQIKAENQAKLIAIEKETKRIYDEKFASIKAQKVAYLAEVKATATKSPSGLEYKIIQKGTGKKPVDGAEILIHYAGYLEDGSLFDSSYEEVNKTYGKFEERRASQNGYQPFPFQYGKKEGLIPGFIEGLNTLSYGDKAILFIPSKLGYGERGAGDVIPPNSNIIFEIEIIEGAAVAPTK